MVAFFYHFLVHPFAKPTELVKLHCVNKKIVLCCH